MRPVRDDWLQDPLTPRAGLEGSRFELRYRSLSAHRCSYAFPCDASGRVNLDLLSERGRESYLYARAMVGRDLLQPQVLTVH